MGGAIVALKSCTTAHFLLRCLLHLRQPHMHPWRSFPFKVLPTLMRPISPNGPSMRPWVQISSICCPPNVLQSAMTLHRHVLLRIQKFLIVAPSSPLAPSQFLDLTKYSMSMTQSVQFLPPYSTCIDLRRIFVLLMSTYQILCQSTCNIPTPFS